jgi:transcriptional regulator with XRE-family HTH domain
MLKYINKTAEEVRDMTDIEIRTNIMNALIECRKEKALTQEQVANAFEVKPTTVASWEQGKSLPSPQMLYRLALYYNKTINYIYGEREA